MKEKQLQDAIFMEKMFSTCLVSAEDENKEDKFSVLQNKAIHG